VNDVTLTGYEMAMASDAGRLRNISAIKDGRKSKIEGGEWQAHIEGAAGEVAAAKCMNVFWGGSVNTFGTGWEVRTRSKHEYDLIVRDSDPDGRVMILVTGKSPNFRVQGWIKTEEAKRAEFLQNYGGYGRAYFVPKSRLNLMEDLYEHRSSNVGF
jgi:hypothetical protein